MKVIRDYGERVIVELGARELDALMLYFIDVDRTKPILDGEDVGDLAAHIEYWLKEHEKYRN